MNKLLVILGPTSTGKTDLALSLAKKFSSKGRPASGWNGELVSCDSRQVYRRLDIGTGKMPTSMSNVKCQMSHLKKQRGFWEIGGVKIWMYDVASPKRQYNVSRFVKDATKVIENIHKRGKLPILVGGTGLYIKAITEGLPNLTIPVDKKLRKNLEKLSLSNLQRKLREISTIKWENLNDSDRQNPRRLVRAIEIASTDLTSEESLRATVRGGFKTLKIGLTAPREILYQRVNEGIVRRLNQGMIDEAIDLHKVGLSLKRMRQLGLEYGVLADFLENKISKDQLIKTLQGKIHAFAGRQITWFKKTCLPAVREKEIHWFDITDNDYLVRIENLVTKWYYS